VSRSRPYIGSDFRLISVLPNIFISGRSLFVSGSRGSAPSAQCHGNQAPTTQYTIAPLPCERILSLGDLFRRTTSPCSGADSSFRGADPRIYGKKRNLTQPGSLFSCAASPSQSASFVANLHRQPSQVSGPKNCPGLVSRVTLRVCKSKATSGESLPR
jgi:hypothetical protein